MNVSQVRNALANNLSTIDGVNVNPYAMAQPTPPGLQILPPEVTYDLAMRRGLDEWIFTVQGFVALTSDIGSQQLLDEMCAPYGPSSVKAALESDGTLGGVVFDANVLDQSAGRVVLSEGSTSPMLFVEWRVKVLAKGS